MIESLDDASRPGARALAGLLGVATRRSRCVLGVALLAGLLRRRRDGLVPGVALGVVGGAPRGSPPTRRATATGSASSAPPTHARRARRGRTLPYTLWLALGVVAGGAALGEPPAARARRAPARRAPPPAGC